MASDEPTQDWHQRLKSSEEHGDQKYMAALDSRGRAAARSRNCHGIHGQANGQHEQRTEVHESKGSVGSDGKTDSDFVLAERRLIDAKFIQNGV